MERPHAKEILRAPRAVIAAQHVREALNGTSTPAASATPTVELVREGDRIRAIDITCGCGETLRIVCEYNG